MHIIEKNKNVSILDHPLSKESAQNFINKISNADQPLALVKQLGAHDLLIVLSEADDEQYAQLLALANQEQFDGVLDLACWRGDKPNLEKVVNFVAPLVATGLEGATLAYDRLGDEVKTLLLSRHLIVHLREDKDDLIPAADDSELIACPDNYYFIEIPDSSDITDVERQLLTALINKPFEEYQREFECIRHDFVSELEENALRWRNGRLADLGFGTREEGLALLSPRDPQQVKKAIEKAAIPHPLHSNTIVPAIYRDNITDNSLLDRSLGILAASENQQWKTRFEVIASELSAMTSLFLTGINCDLGNIEDVASGSRWARDILTLGLETVSDNDPIKGAKAFAYQTPSAILQAGMGMLIPIRQRARAVKKDKRLMVDSVKGALLDAPLAIAINLLSKDIPGWWPALDDSYSISPVMIDPMAQEIVAFSCLKQLNQAQRYLLEAEMLADLLVDTLNYNPKDLLRKEKNGEGILASSLLYTAFANASINDEFRVTLISTEEAQTFCASILELEVETFYSNAIGYLSEFSTMNNIENADLDKESDPTKRLVLRLLHIGRERLSSGDLSQNFLIY